MKEFMIMQQGNNNYSPGPQGNPYSYDPINSSQPHPRPQPTQPNYQNTPQGGNQQGFPPQSYYPQRNGYSSYPQGQVYPPQQQPYQSNDDAPSSLGQWVITLLLTLIPIVNIIFLCIWAFGSSPEDPSKRNWAKAELIFLGIEVVISIIIGISLAGAGLTAGLSSY